MPSHVTTPYVAHHHDKQWLAEAVKSGKSTRAISKELKISYKLVEMKLREFNIPFTSTAPEK